MRRERLDSLILEMAAGFLNTPFTSETMPSRPPSKQTLMASSSEFLLSSL